MREAVNTLFSVAKRKSA